MKGVIVTHFVGFSLDRSSQLLRRRVFLSRRTLSRVHLRSPVKSTNADYQLGVQLPIPDSQTKNVDGGRWSGEGREGGRDRKSLTEKGNRPTNDVSVCVKQTH